jgi:hypothetical protein
MDLLMISNPIKDAPSDRIQGPSPIAHDAENLMVQRVAVEAVADHGHSEQLGGKECSSMICATVQRPVEFQ